MPLGIYVRYTGPNPFIPQIKCLHKIGLSTRQISKRVPLSYARIHKLLKAVGGVRTRRDALRTRLLSSEPKTSRSARSQSRKAMSKSLGRPLLRHEEVHHKDENPFNRSLSNLELLSSTDHRHRHRPPNPVPRHLRPERQEYMRKYQLNYRKGPRAPKES